MVFVIFFAHLSQGNHRSAGERLRDRNRWNILFWMVIWSATAITIGCCTAISSFGFRTVLMVHVFMTGVLFGSLSIILIHRCYLLNLARSKLASSDWGISSANLRQNLTLERLIYVSSILIVCLLSRSVYDLALAAGALHVHDHLTDRSLPIDSILRFETEPLSTAAILLVWEFIPTIVLMGYFWHIPKPSSVEEGQRSRRSTVYGSTVVDSPLGRESISSLLATS